MALFLPTRRTVPAGVSKVVVDAFGAQGYEGASGGWVQASLPVLGGQMLYIVVGGFHDGDFHHAGGGASDIRTTSNDLASRLIVAGGGGGFEYGFAGKGGA